MISLLSLSLPCQSWANEAAYRLAQGAFVAAQYADARTTELALNRGATEANFLYGSHPSDVRLYATKAILTVAVLAATARLRRAGRPRTAIVLLVLGTVIMTGAAVMNDGVAR